MNGHLPRPTGAPRSPGRRLIAIVLAASLGIAAGCGGSPQPQVEDFSDGLQRIGAEGSARWGRVAEWAGDLEPDEPISGELDQAIRELLAFQRRAVVELRALKAPEAGAEATEMLIEALEERTVVFEQALQAGRFSGDQFDRIEKAGDAIAVALGQLRAKGLIPTAEDHEQP